MRGGADEASILEGSRGDILVGKRKVLKIKVSHWVFLLASDEKGAPRIRITKKGLSLSIEEGRRTGSAVFTIVEGKRSK